MNVTEYYESELRTRGYQSDEAQLAAVARLQQCYEEWVAYKSRRSNALKKFLVRPDLPRGVYMWGGVGRGKSFLMTASMPSCRCSARRGCIFTSSCAKCIASWKS